MSSHAPLVIALLQWAHIVAGVFWIGLLYYFNVVQVPVFKKFDAATRSNAIQKLVPVALAWFRYAALATLVFGLLLLYYRYGQVAGGLSGYLQTPAGVSISLGMGFAAIMVFNVWYLIWPNQKKIIAANVAKAAAGTDIPPESAQWAKTAFYASRFNFVTSFPVIFWMVATTHYVTTQRNLILAGFAIFALAGVALWYFTGMKKPGTAPATAPTAPPTK